MSPCQGGAQGFLPTPCLPAQARQQTPLSQPLLALAGQSMQHLHLLQLTRPKGELGKGSDSSPGVEDSVGREVGKEISEILVPPHTFCYLLAEMVFHLDSLQQSTTPTQSDFPVPHPPYIRGIAKLFKHHMMNSREKHQRQEWCSPALWNTWANSHFPQIKNKPGEDEHKETR